MGVTVNAYIILAINTRNYKPQQYLLKLLCDMLCSPMAKLKRESGGEWSGLINGYGALVEH
jgi:hypothetical protein